MNKPATGQDVIRLFESWVPKHLAMEGDKIGLHVGTLNKPVHKVMITLDVLENVVDEAIEKEIDLIIAHHPLIFKPLKKITPDDEKGRIVEKLIKHNITVYAAHTNLDIAEGGVNDLLMDQLGIEDREVLIEMGSEELVKVVVFVPETHQEEVREALGNAGAGHIGHYSHCTFQTEGQGTFKPLEGTNPFIGKQGELEKVDEVRMETIVPVSILSRVLKAMEESHPYEEVAYDLYPLKNEGKTYGLGRIGRLEQPISLKEFAEHAKQAFKVSGLRVTGDLTRQVQTIGVIGGDGNKFISQARRKGVDVLITGDLYYHTAHDALGMGLSVIDPGHHIEKVMKNGVQTYLSRQLSKNGYDTEVMVSEINTDPFQFL
ncbi:dinuclear metal center YbgI/SA1388 family protein [Melghiribacillus thermohalophilus]|uniref:GTP cyclohydrolase 1 type 2 homolog n=1 Tax=Melghiribacillus thermohalophilus TaxID=1324956 RepID=A0A4R3NI82_9BACI|nr:Nif3-like dinuclear metal center hexameric protein [Melghiribacillus thermohalophilus]TCT27002.1 dinuclear metal center YbgI/SA1388 family protein [Melghiribacillus thermohalophilus]